MNHEQGRLKPWNSMREVAAHLSLSLRSLERRIKDGRLQAKKDGRLVRIKREWVLAYEMAGLL